MLIKRLLTTFALIAVFASCCSASLVDNGSFENPDVSDGGFGILNAGNTTLTGWTISDGGQTANNGGVTVIDSWNIGFSSGIIAQASDGEQLLNLQNTGDAGTISQTLATTAGSQYLLTFDYGAVAFGTRTLNLNYEIDGQSQDLSVDIPAGFQQIGWFQESLLFTASTNSTTLSFTGNHFNGFYGVALDNVAVNAIPEPSSMVLLGASLAGFVIRRRR
ncbi:MAG: DUF642 domain-containing protein [Planctomycetota bacterium]